MKKIVLVAFSAVFIFLTSCNETSTIDYIEFDKVENSELVNLIKQQQENEKTPIVYFYANWCGPCKKFSKALKSKLLNETFKNAVLIKVNVDNNSEIAIKYSVRAIPTFIKMDENGVVLARITSSEWEEDTPENINSVMHKLINTNYYLKK
jgi:thioredoxin 1